MKEINYKNFEKMVKDTINSKENIAINISVEELKGMSQCTTDFKPKEQ